MILYLIGLGLAGALGYMICELRYRASIDELIEKLES